MRVSLILTLSIAIFHTIPVIHPYFPSLIHSSINKLSLREEEDYFLNLTI